MADRDTLIAALEQTKRRLWRNRALALSMMAATALAGLAAVALIVEALVAARHGPAGHGLATPVLILALAFAALVVWFRLSSPRLTLERAAAEADARAGLDDTLKSALWFARGAEPSPWTDILVARAAGVARNLDPVRLLPFARPRGIGIALGVVGVLLLTSRIVPALVPAAGPVAAGAGTAIKADVDQVAVLNDLADRAARAGDTATAAKLRRAAAALQDPGTSLADRQQALAQARAALDQGGLEAGASLEALRQLADNLGNRDDMREVADALRKGDAGKAADALRKVAEARGEKPMAADKAGEKSDTSKTVADDLKDAIQSSAPGAADDKGGDTQGKLAKAVQGLQELAQKLDVAQRANQAGRKLDAAATSLSRQSTVQAARFGQSQGGANSGDSPDTGNASIKGGTMFRLGAVAKDKQGSQREGGRAGDASGENQGEPVVGDEITRIEAKYKLEAVKGRDSDVPDGPDDKFYAASRASEATTAFAAVTPTYRHASEEPMAAERIALRHRAIVKQYFSQAQEQAQP